MTRSKTFLLSIYNLFNQFGFDPIKCFRSIIGIFPYIKDLYLFGFAYSGRLSINPCFYDRFEYCGSTRSEYFWQDLIVARWIYEANPHKHVDVGSRVDGFVAHVASFRNIEVLDVRPISSSIPGINFRQVDLTSEYTLSQLQSEHTRGYCDSISCLHVIEHFGLGRYGDDIDPVGYISGLANLSSLLQPGGSLYLSCPVGHSRVEFNSHRVFSPYELLDLASKCNLSLHRLVVFNPSGGIRKISLDLLSHELQVLSTLSYTLAIMHFVKH